NAFGVDDFERLQHDSLAWNATELVPLLARARSDRRDVEDARGRLLEWDRRLTVDSDVATLYALWERHLLRGLVKRQIDSALLDEFAARARSVLVPALTKASRAWFSAGAKARDELLIAALADAVDEARARQN